MVITFGGCVHVQSYSTLCDPLDCSPSGSSVHGVLQARIMEWVVIPFSREEVGRAPLYGIPQLVQSLAEGLLCF